MKRLMSSRMVTEGATEYVYVIGMGKGMEIVQFWCGAGSWNQGWGREGIEHWGLMVAVWVAGKGGCVMYSICTTMPVTQCFYILSSVKQYGGSNCRPVLEVLTQEGSFLQGMFENKDYN
jgi:hypothetical protein